MLEVIGRVIAVGFMLLAAVCWFAGVYYMIRTHVCRKPGVPLFMSFWYRPLFNFYEPADLTQEGTDAQEKYWACFWGFLVCFAIAFVAGSLSFAHFRRG